MKDSNNRYALDANVILRYLLQDNEVLSGKASLIIRAIAEGQVIATLDPVNLAEVVWVLRSSYMRTPAEIAEWLLAIIQCDLLQMRNKAHYTQALQIYEEGATSFGDACACAEAVETCDGNLLSFDKALSRIPGVSRHEDV